LVFKRCLELPDVLFQFFDELSEGSFLDVFLKFLNALAEDAYLLFFWTVVEVFFCVLGFGLDLIFTEEVGNILDVIDTFKRFKEVLL